MMAGNFLSVEDERNVVEELKLEMEKFEHYMNLFKGWVVSQAHLPQTFNDHCLKKFLLWAKLDFEKAKKKFETFCYNGVTHKNFVGNRIVTLDGDLNAGKHCFILPMSKLTPNRYKVVICGVLDGDSLDLLQCARFLTMLYDFKLHKDCSVAGEILVIDMKHLKPRHYTKFFAPNIFKFVKFTIHNYHFIIKNIFIINCHPAMKKGIDLFKSIISAKIAKRIIILTNSTELSNYIPSYCLPAEYGGTCKTIDELRQDFLKYMIENQQFLEDISKTIPIGPIPEKFRNLSEEFGIDGCFRKLNID